MKASALQKPTFAVWAGENREHLSFLSNVFLGEAETMFLPLFLIRRHDSVHLLVNVHCVDTNLILLFGLATWDCWSGARPPRKTLPVILRHQSFQRLGGDETGPSYGSFAQPPWVAGIPPT